MMRRTPVRVRSRSIRTRIAIGFSGALMARASCADTAPSAGAPIRMRSVTRTRITVSGRTSSFFVRDYARTFSVCIPQSVPCSRSVLFYFLVLCQQSLLLPGIGRRSISSCSLAMADCIYYLEFGQVEVLATHQSN
jgi:hypothetical protein